MILKLDIKDFFPSISTSSIYHVFVDCGYATGVSVLLARCVTLKGGLPEGAPTSPALSNLVMNNFDAKLSEYCLSKGIRYTRYADDMTFSGNLKKRNELIRVVSQMLAVMGLKLNTSKVRVLRDNNHQIVTGILVNEKLNTPRSFRRSLRLECHYALDGDLEKNVENKIESTPTNSDIVRYLRSLLGKVNFVLFVNPQIRQFQTVKQRLVDKIAEYMD